MTAILLIQLCLSLKVRVIPECGQNDQCNVYNGYPIEGLLIDHSNISKAYEYFDCLSRYQSTDVLEIYGEPPVSIFEFDFFPHPWVDIYVRLMSSDTSAIKYFKINAGSQRKYYTILRGPIEILNGNLKTEVIFFHLQNEVKAINNQIPIDAVYSDTYPGENIPFAS
jgi:hypothetical protein